MLLMVGLPIQFHSSQTVIEGCINVNYKTICSCSDFTVDPSITTAEIPHSAAPHALFRQISSPIRHTLPPDPKGQAALLGHKTQLSTPVIRPWRGGDKEGQTRRMGDTAARAKRHPSIRCAQSSVPKGWQADRLPRNQRCRSPPENEAITAVLSRGHPPETASGDLTKETNKLLGPLTIDQSQLARL